MSNLQVWADNSLEKDEMEQVDRDMADARSGEFAKPQDGRNRYRFLPTPRDEEGKKKWPTFKTIYEHFIDGIPGMKGKLQFVCPRLQVKGGKMRCPACEEADRLRRRGNQIDKDRAFQMQASPRVYANVLDRQRPEKGPLVITMGTMIWKGVKKLVDDPEIGTAMLDPTANGIDVIIEKEGDGQQSTKYFVRVARKSSPLDADEDIALDWLNKQWDLTKYTVVPEPENLLKVFRGEEGSSLRAGSERKQLGSGKRRDDDDDGDDSDDEEPAPRAKKEKSAADDPIAKARAAMLAAKGSDEKKKKKKKARRSAQDDLEDGPVIDVDSDDDVPI